VRLDLHRRILLSLCVTIPSSQQVLWISILSKNHQLLRKLSSSSQFDDLTCSNGKSAHIYMHSWIWTRMLLTHQYEISSNVKDTHLFGTWGKGLQYLLVWLTNHMYWRIGRKSKESVAQKSREHTESECMFLLWQNRRYLFTCTWNE